MVTKPAFFQEKKDDEVPEEEVEMPSVKRLMLLNSTEWPYLAIGSFFAAIVGAFPVAFAIILSEILKVIISIQNSCFIHHCSLF